ncbi:phospho-sugar mutase [Corynebacterium sp. NPDC060344]|uniref:phospho-sugar mutase n=1 Tax=Corynebacterium sp. NPDC060344 TaxID=3347101 RepID=UPI00365FA96E
MTDTDPRTADNATTNTPADATTTDSATNAATITDPAVLAAAREWLAHDPDDATRDELSTLIQRAESGGSAPAEDAKATDSSDAAAELADRFSGPLTFGTAGLRGEVGAGESRMNRATVIRATAGLCAHLRDIVGDGFTVVVGCDARHGSSDFHRDAAAVIAAAGGRALALPPQLPTPVTAFAVRHLGADAGVMVTASHNPPRDNGYKVYLGGRAVDSDERRGVQIIAPHDAAIAAHIAAAPPADEVPRDEAAVEHLGSSLVDDYVARATSLATAGADARAAVSVVVTPMHGVGGETITRVLREAGFTDVAVVEEQFAPDPDFPTVAFPNPEEDGALDLAFELARERGADVIIAADPDADRCSVAIPDAGVDGGWRQLSGDEIGALLGEMVAAQVEAEHMGAGSSSSNGDAQPALANSIVSSRLNARIAADHGLAHATTLTGFKWIAGTPGMVFGYEEAIGYCTDPTQVRDKDGVTAAVRVADLVAALKAGGRGPADLLDDLARAHGLHKTAPLTFRVDDVALIAEGMARLRANPPATLAGSEVTAVHDLSDGWNGLPPTDGLMLLTADDDRVIARPSGTEPKLKCYLEVIVPVEGAGASSGDDAAVPVPHDEAAARLRTIAAELSEVLGM